jgi:hypothetical protein
VLSWKVVRARGEREDFFLLSLLPYVTAPKTSELVVPRHRVVYDAITIETVGSVVVTFLLMPISEESPYEQYL